MCPILKRIPKGILPYDEAIQFIVEILESKEFYESQKGYDMRFLEHLKLYSENQFGKATGMKYRDIGDGKIFSNWDVDIGTFYQISRLMIYDCVKVDPNPKRLRNDDEVLPHLERSIGLLNSWLVHLDSDHGNHALNYLLLQLCQTERSMAIFFIGKNQPDVAEGHCQRCLSYIRRYGEEGEQKVTYILFALGTYVDLRKYQGKFEEAIIFAEEAYNVVVVAYDCVHPLVQKAAGILISCLIMKGNLVDAERYAEVTYANLRDHKNGMDQESEDVAMGAYNLANVIFRQNGDLVKAERLARESIRIRAQLFGSNHSTVGLCCDLLANILQSQGKLGDETRILFERSLAISFQTQGPNAQDTAAGNIHLGQYHHNIVGEQSTVESKREQLLIAKGYLEEGLRIDIMIHGATHPDTVSDASVLSIVLYLLSNCF
jgi:hypothetical protein